MRCICFKRLVYHTHRNIMATNYHSNRVLKKNSRFECLNNDVSEARPDDRSPQDSQYSRGDSQYSQRRDRISRRHAGKFSFLSSKTKRPHISINNEINNGSFPSLGHVKEVSLHKPDKTDYLDMASKEEDDIVVKKNIPTPLKSGYIYISRKGNNTTIHTIDNSGKKIREDSRDNKPDEFNHKKFQKECAVASYSILRDIQRVRDDENETFGASSSHWGKGKLTDLSYLSDSDVESDESEKEYDHTTEYCSDDETY